MIVDGAVDRATSELDGRVPILVEAGYQGFWAAETNESVAVTLQRVAMLGSSDHDLFASTAIAFARSPMTLAYDFATLKAGSAGVVRLGIGSQIRQHIRKRFGMPWYNPISQMRDYVQALRTIWDAWLTGGPLQYRGQFYRFVLMPDFYRPMLKPTDTLEIHLAAFGPEMTALAAEVADGIILHPMATARYVREVTLPAIERGLQRRQLPGRPHVSQRPIVVSGVTEDHFEEQKHLAIAELAFHLATPAYTKFYECEGLLDLHRSLRREALRSDWQSLMSLIDDQILSRVAIVGEPNGIAEAVHSRTSSYLDRVCLPTPATTTAEVSGWADQVVYPLRALNISQETL